MKKRILALLLSLLMLLGMAACAAPAEAPETEETIVPEQTAQQEQLYQPGVYTAAAQGNNGEVTVEVTFSETAILSVEVKEHSETAGICDAAIEKVPAQIVESQSVAVDTVSGATNTSRAILAAVEDCIVQAGGEVSAPEEGPKESAAGEGTEKTADVIVVGGGGAGLAAAVSAAQEGASVVLIEKSGVMGGNTIMSGAGLNAADPGRQGSDQISDAMKKQLESYLEYVPEEFGEFAPEARAVQQQVKDYLESGADYLFDSPELHMVQSYLGSKRTGLDGTEIVPDHTLLSVMCGRAMETCEWMETLGVEFKPELSTAVGALWKRTHDVVGGASQLIATMVESAEKHGVEIMTLTKGCEILMEDGVAVGIRAEADDGAEMMLHANKGVILATGGFASNAVMVKEYNNYWANLPETMPCDGSVNCVGDGIAMAKAVNANLVGMGFIQILPICTIDGQAIRGTQNKIYVNREGVRFVNENNERDKLVSAILAQTGSRMYAVGDVTQYELQGEEKLQRLIGKGYACMADTLEELAEQAEALFGMDGAAFLKTVESYNSYVDQQNDPEFGRYNFIGRIDTPPYIMIMEAPALHHTMGGVEINETAQVVDVEGQPIEGLYAAGEVTGGIHAGNRLGGNAILDIFTFGRIAGSNAAK